MGDGGVVRLEPTAKVVRLSSSPCEPAAAAATAVASHTCDIFKSVLQQDSSLRFGSASVLSPAQLASTMTVACH
jgi:Zn-dependent membrane protease YugP